MKNLKIIKYALFMLLFSCLFNICASAKVWVFGSSGQGQNPFTTKGYAIKTESGKIQWLYSKFDNGGYDVSGNMHMQDIQTVYTGTNNGVQYINATKADGTTYQLYAFTNRNPLIYNYMFAYQKKSQNGDFTKIDDFTSRLGTPIRTSTNLTEFPNGISQQWAIPINNFVFQPGTLYEFGFLQGMQANNGISLVLQDDGAGHYYGYLANPFSTDEQALYDKMKSVEYQFISSYTKVAGTDYYNVNFVPMRFSVQTYADLTVWNATAAKVKSFINGITQSDFNNGRYSQASIENLKSELDSMQNEADTQVKCQLKAEADNSIAEMVNKITSEMNLAKTETVRFSDMTKLNAALKAANDFLNTAKNNVGTTAGNYKKETVVALKQTIDMAKALTKENKQSDIDKAVTALENAITDVKASQIKADKIVLSDFVNGINVTLKTGSVPDNVSLIVNRIDAAAQKYGAIKDSIGDNVKEIRIYNILLYSGDKIVKPSQPMTVQFPVPNSMKKSDISVYSSDNNLKSSKIASIRTKSFVGINSSSTGYFSLVSYGKAITVSKNISQAASSAAENPQTSGNLPSITEKASRGKVDVIKQTNAKKKEKPDIKERSLNITAGAGNTAMSAMLDGKSRPKGKIPDTVIPKSEILKKSNPFWLLLCAAVLGLLGAVYGTALIIGKHKSSH